MEARYVFSSSQQYLSDWTAVDVDVLKLFYLEVSVDHKMFAKVKL